MGDAAKNPLARYSKQNWNLKKKPPGKVLISFEEEFANNVQRMLPNHWATRKGDLAESLWGFFGTQFWQTTDRSFQHFDKDDLKHQIRDTFKHYFRVGQTTNKSIFFKLLE